MRDRRWSALAWGVGGALIGGVVFLGVLHLYLDHLALHQMGAWVTSVAPKVNQLP